MTIGQLRAFIENMPDEAKVIFAQGGGDRYAVLRLLEYDEHLEGGISFWMAEKGE